jgi:cbb3-type cytochrome oxidase maturation protein
MTKIRKMLDEGHLPPRMARIHLQYQIVQKMSVIILLLIASLSVALCFLGAFIWGVKNRQFEDGYAPPLRILFDDDLPAEKEPETLNHPNPSNK